jgi:6-phosphofructokinase 1
MALKRIGVLTSGGDAPGMNAAIRAVVRYAGMHNIEVLGIRRGYNGLLASDVQEMSQDSVSNILNRGGTMLYTARCLDFMTPEGVERGKQACKFLGLDGLIAIGGDGTFRGLRDLSAAGIATVGIPGTIDNDIACTNYSIGFDTACNTAVDAIDKLRDTMQSHERCSIVEVMGHRSGHLAVYVGIATGANTIIVPERQFDFETEIADKIRYARIHGRSHFIVIIAEGAGSAVELGNRIKEETGMDPRVTVLGHIQRGGTPSVRDRVTASRMGKYAVDVLLEGRSQRVVGIIGGQMNDYDIVEALNMDRDLQETMYETAQALSRIK